MPTTSDPRSDTVPPSAAKSKATPTPSASGISTADLARALQCGSPGCPCQHQGHPAMWQVHCPGHDDQSPSLGLIVGKTGKPIFTCRAGCENKAIIAALTKKGLWSARVARNTPKIVAQFEYHHSQGAVLCRVNRVEPGYRGEAKSFTFDHPAPFGQGWHRGLGGSEKYPECSCPRITPILYRLPELLAAPLSEVIFIVEGEGKIDRLKALGLTATCNPMGAGKWQDHYNQYLEDRTVIIPPPRRLGERGLERFRLFHTPEAFADRCPSEH